MFDVRVMEAGGDTGAGERKVGAGEEKYVCE